MRATHKAGIVSLCISAAAFIAVARPEAASALQKSSGAVFQPACSLATNFNASASGAQAPVRIYRIHPADGITISSRLTGAPALIGLAWGPDNKLYGVSEANAPAGYQPNSLYRIDPSTGATTLIGSTGLGPLVEGDLATDPQTGTIYGVDRERLFRFPGVTATGANATAQVVGQIRFPPMDTAWDISGLAFDGDGRLHAVAQSTNPNGPVAHLIRLDLAHISNGIIPVDRALQLSQRFDVLGGLDFIGGAMLYASGNAPSQTPGPFNQLYFLYAINMSSGAVTVRGPSSIPGGISAMVVCRPPPCAPQPPAMAAWYGMDGTGHDRVSGSTAPATGAVAFVPDGRVLQSVRFQGGHLAVPDGPALDQGSGDFSIDLWINVAANQSATQAIADKRGLVANRLRGWVLFLANGRIGLQLADNATENFADGRTMTPGWHHVAVTVDRDNPQGLRFYIDGVAGAPFNPTRRMGNLDNNAATWFGRDHSSNRASLGLEIDEVEFFHRVLAPAEIRAIADAAEVGKCIPKKWPAD